MKQILKTEHHVDTLVPYRVQVGFGPEEGIVLIVFFVGSQKFSFSVEPEDATQIALDMQSSVERLTQKVN